MKKTIIGILYGGRSAEHKVSIQSTKNVLAAIDRRRYKPVLFKIPKRGAWPTLGDLQKLRRVDVVFPILHGPFGEDGTIQGLLKLLDLPFVGADVLGSAVAMDKDVMKRLLREAKIPIAEFVSFCKDEQDKISFSKIKKQLGLPLFIKPANMGSSVGISKVTTSKEFFQALKIAFRYDVKIIIEEAIAGRELECSVLGNDKPVASLPGEIIPKDGFYSYERKYVDQAGAVLVAPAKLPKEIIKQIRSLAVKVFKLLECSGMGRVDMFLTKKNKLVVNELNTIPGFTNISMYPKLWQASGISYSRLIDVLIRLAIKRYKALP